MNFFRLTLFLLISSGNLFSQEFALKKYVSYTKTAIAKQDIDLNNDGYMDHVVLNEIDGAVILYENIKDNYFNELLILSNTEKIAKDIKCKDLNGDGTAEVIISYQGNASIRIYQYLPSGTLNEIGILKNSLQGQIEIFDVDQDGMQDIISFYNNAISYHRNLGNITFSNAIKINFPATKNVTAIYNNQLSNTSILSYTLSDYTLGVIEFVNQQVKTRPIVTLNKSYSQFKIKDFNNDNIWEIYCVFTTVEAPNAGVTGQQVLSVVQIDSTYINGYFGKNITTELDRIYDYNIMDMDGDQLPEAMISHTKRIYDFYYIEVYHRLAIYKKNITGQFIRETFFDAGYYCRAMSQITKKDGRQALAFISYGGHYLAYIEDVNTSNKKLDIKTVVCYGDNDFAFKDFDKDGSMDILMAKNATLNKHSFNLYKNKFNFTKLENKDIPSSHTNLKVTQFWFQADLNNDGEDEIIASASSDNLYLYKYSQDSMESKNIISSIIIDGCMPHDMDNDGDLDIIIFGSNHSVVGIYDYHLSIMENKGNYIFEQKIITSKIQGKHVELTDFNNDGLMDMLSSESKDFVPFGELNPTYLYLYINKGNLEFTRTQYSTTIASSYFKLVDVDNDKDLDIVSINDTKLKISLYINNNKSYSEIALSSINHNGINDYEIFDAGDIDKDGDIDIVAYIKEMYIFEFKSNYTFTKTLIAPGANKNAVNHKTLMEVLDIDYDKDQDVIRITPNNQFEIYFNVINRSKISVGAFFDENENGIKETEERLYPDFNTYIGEIGAEALLKRVDGYFHYFVDDGTFTIIYDTSYNKNWTLTTEMAHSVTASDNSQDTILFGLKPKKIFKEVIPSMTSTITRCNTTAQFYLSLTNTGTTVLNGKLICDVTSNLLSKSYHQPVDKISNKKLEYFVTDFYPGESLKKSFSGKVPPINSFYPLGTKLDFKLTFVTNDSVYEQSSEYQSILRCSFDPNDKLATPARPDSTFLADEYLRYTIRFQNTGNDTAFKVVIRDTLQDGYDVNSLRIINSSHSDKFTFSIKENKYLEFAFDDIILPDSTTNFLASQGFVSYAIKGDRKLVKGDQVKNTAHIYFDFNPAIVTNTQVNILTDKITSITEYFDDGSIKLYPNPFSSMLYINGLNQNCIYDILDIHGRIIHHGLLLSGETSLDLGHLSKGMYIINLLIGKEHRRYKVVKI